MRVQAVWKEIQAAQSEYIAKHNSEVCLWIILRKIAKKLKLANRYQHQYYASIVYFVLLVVVYRFQ